MKNETERKMPTVSKQEVLDELPKTEAILLRLSKRDKEAITSAAKLLHLTATEYLVKCHKLVAEKLSKE